MCQAYSVLSNYQQLQQSIPSGLYHDVQLQSAYNAFLIAVVPKSRAYCQCVTYIFNHKNTHLVLAAEYDLSGNEGLT